MNVKFVHSATLALLIAASAAHAQKFFRNGC